MKKYFLNPSDIFLGVFGIFLTGGVFTALLISFIITWRSTQSINFGITIALFLLPLLLMIPQVCYIKKYRGYIYLNGSHLILKKGKKQIVIEISNIRWIGLRYDFRSGAKGKIGVEKKFRFFIRLNNQKEDLDFIITNQIILDIIKKHNIRIMPDQYNQIYINTGKFDFR